MPRRSIRTAFLTLAAWAVLFAPGTASAAGGGEGSPTDPDRGARIISTPFGHDGVVATRPARSDDGQSKSSWVVLGGVTTAPPTVPGEASASGTPDERNGSNSDEGERHAPTRAPPAD